MLYHCVWRLDRYLATVYQTFREKIQRPPWPLVSNSSKTGSFCVGSLKSPAIIKGSGHWETTFCSRDGSAEHADASPCCLQCFGAMKSSHSVRLENVFLVSWYCKACSYRKSTWKSLKYSSNIRWSPSYKPKKRLVDRFYIRALFARVSFLPSMTLFVGRDPKSGDASLWATKKNTLLLSSILVVL